MSSRFDAVLRLVFDDTGAYAQYVDQGGDNPSTMSPEQALDVAAFVLEHERADALVIHCTAGVSRSRSLAAAVSDALSLPYQWTVVNDDVYRAAKQAFRSLREGPR